MGPLQQMFLGSNPRRNPRHVPHDPFQVRALFVPTHGCRWNVTTKCRQTVRKIRSPCRKLLEILFGEDTLVGIFVQQNPLVFRV